MSDNHQGTSFRHSRESGNPVAQASGTSLSSDNTARPEPVEGPTSSRHSREACPRPRSGSGNPVAQTEADNPTHPVTYLDILNFNLAQLIRSETADGHTIVEFLLHIMTGRDSAYTPNKLRIKPADRMAASREILRRGYGHFGRRRRLIDDAEETNDYDTLHTDLAKRLRQYSEEGSQVILFLLNVMKNEVPDEQYTTRHRMSAAQELLRRGWDTNYDKIKSEHLIDYWQEQQSARLSVGQKKQLAGLQTYADEYDAYDNKDYEPQAQALRAQQDRESEAISPRHSREACPRPRSGSGNPEAQNKETSRASKPTPNPNPKKHLQLHQIRPRPRTRRLLRTPKPRRPSPIRLPHQNRIRRLHRRRNPAAPRHRGRPPGLPSHAQMDTRNRRSRRRPRPTQPPIRHPKTPKSPQPLTPDTQHLFVIHYTT